MKVYSKLFVLILAMTPLRMTIAQDYKADDILGTWMNEDKDAHIEIFKEDGMYFGKIVWLKDPIDEETGKPKVDEENPDEALQDRPIMGLVLLKNFEFEGGDEWEDGSIYDPKNGKTYSCYMELKGMDKLKIRGYVGISLLGRTTYWTRVDE
ncbi:MAG: DUF2147 domain-containing protein [Bacteroidales bacterium]|nr:DUF2147 domain-containing protein [Bacteroidales bacterium]MCF8386495.1 DUF2147 domain-containing protein [Bacteroidales bacterium]MCF8397101.1 DUF2147 domain-containing protein [Bacteroidales bacterium]